MFLCSKYFVTFISAHLFAATAYESRSASHENVFTRDLAAVSLLQEHVISSDVEQSLITLPKQFYNRDWSHVGGCTQHIMHHLGSAESVQFIWRNNNSSGVSYRDRLLSQPVVSGQRIYVTDSNAVVHAIATDNGAQLWDVSLLPDDEDSDVLLSGGMAYGDGKLFVTTGWGEIVTIDASTGKELWRRDVGVPIRAAPTVSETRVFILDRENEIRALAADSGTELWYRRGLAEVTTLLGGSALAVDGNVVIAALSSGDIVALRTENGNQMWSYPLISTRQKNFVDTLSAILAPPIIDHDQIYVVGYNGVTVAIDLSSGRLLWEADIGGTQQPWVAGDFLFMLTKEANIVALEKGVGRTIWSTPLPRWLGSRSSGIPIHWIGPTLAGNRLIVSSSDGRLVTVSPYTGKILSEDQLPSEVIVPLTVSDGTIYLLTKAGELVAYR